MIERETEAMKLCIDISIYAFDKRKHGVLSIRPCRGTPDKMAPGRSRGARKLQHI